MNQGKQQHIFNVFLLLLLPSLTVVEALSLTTSHNSLSNNEINVWDNVVPPLLCEQLHLEASKAGLGHKAFTRPLIPDVDGSESKNRPLIELAIDEILTKLGDDVGIGNSTTDNDDDDGQQQQQFVEYWTRQEWRHIEAHADVDENLAKEEDKSEMETSQVLPFRFPSRGHVLYLKVGTEVQGPTCLFPKRSSGKDLLKSDNDNNNNNNNSDEEIELVTVPAVEGRLLRFEGSTLHAVPRPADLWFLSFVKGAPKFTPEETWGRSVILFNTWFGDPPRDVPLDDSKRLDVESEQNDKEELLRVNEVSDWNDIFSFEDSSGLAGNEYEVCEEEQIYGRPAKVWLLGNERRRGQAMRTIKLKAPEETRNMLLEKHSVSRIRLSS